MTNASTRKKILTSAVVVMLFGGLVMAAFPFITSLGPSEEAENQSVVTINIPELEPGKVTKVIVNNVPLFILKPSENQKQSIAQLNEHVWDAKTSSFNEELEAFVYYGLSTNRGCILSHKAPQDSVLMKTKSEAQWFGGFWDNNCEASYDYAGRAIKTYELTFNGLNKQFDNLHSPSVLQKTKNGYLVSIFTKK